VTDWLDDYAARLEKRLGQADASVGVDADARKKLLGLARIVAHGTERKNAPLATYIAGRYAELAADNSGGAGGALAQALEEAREMLGEGDE
jgi:hypothetical protein